MSEVFIAWLRTGYANGEYGTMVLSIHKTQRGALRAIAKHRLGRGEASEDFSEEFADSDDEIEAHCDLNKAAWLSSATYMRNLDDCENAFFVEAMALQE